MRNTHDCVYKKCSCLMQPYGENACTHYCRAQCVIISARSIPYIILCWRRASSPCRLLKQLFVHYAIIAARGLKNTHRAHCRHHHHGACGVILSAWRHPHSVVDKSGSVVNAHQERPAFYYFSHRAHLMNINNAARSLCYAVPACTALSLKCREPLMRVTSSWTLHRSAECHLLIFISRHTRNIRVAPSFLTWGWQWAVLGDHVCVYFM